MIIHSKISSDGDSGGSGHMAPRAPGRRSRTRLDHQAHLIIYFLNDRIHVGKNRTGEVGDITPDQFMNIALKYFARQIYHDVAEVFQQGLIDQIQKAITEVLKENLMTKEIEYDPFRRTRSGDGS